MELEHRRAREKWERFAQQAVVVAIAAAMALCGAFTIILVLPKT